MMAYGLTCVRHSKNPFSASTMEGVSTQTYSQSSKLSIRTQI